MKNIEALKLIIKHGAYRKSDVVIEKTRKSDPRLNELWQFTHWNYQSRYKDSKVNKEQLLKDIEFFKQTNYPIFELNAKIFGFDPIIPLDDDKFITAFHSEHSGLNGTWAYFNFKELLGLLRIERLIEDALKKEFPEKEELENLLLEFKNKN